MAVCLNRKMSIFKGYLAADVLITSQNCMYFNFRALKRETEVNTELFFVRGDRLTVSSTRAASIKLPVVSTHLSGKHLLNPEHCAEEPKHNVWRCGCVRHIMRFSESMHSCAPKCFQAGLEATTEPRRLSPNKLQKLSKNHERVFSLCSRCSPPCVRARCSGPWQRRTTKTDV